MSRLIDADALMATLGITDMDCVKCAWYSKSIRRCKRGGDFEDACCAIENAPTIEPEQKVGKWIKIDDGRISGRCSECGWEAHLYEDDVYGMDYCPNCGMRLEVEG